MDGLPGEASAFQAALALLRQGRTQAALPLLEAVLAEAPWDGLAALNLAMARMDLGRLDAAAGPLATALERLPHHPEPHFRRGRLAHLRGQAEAARQGYEAALVRDPGHVAALCGLAELARAEGRAEASVTLLREALLYVPQDEGIALELARAHVAANQPVEALALAAPLLAREGAPGLAGVVWSEAVLARDGAEGARAASEEALAADPLSPARIAAHATLLDAFGQTREGLRHWHLAEALAPEDVAILSGLAHGLWRERAYKAALPVFERAVALAPGERGLRVGHGEILFRLHRLAEAAESLRATLADLGGDERTHATLALVLVSQGLQEEARLATEAAGGENALVHALCNVGPYHPDMATSAALGEAARALKQRLSQGINPYVPVARPPGERLRVGLLSSNLGRHPVGWLTLPAIEHLPREEFEVVAFSLTDRDDPLARRFRARADRWISFEPGARDQLVLERLRAEALDILIDLSGHGQGGRVRVLRHRAAPVQIKWVGSQSASSGVPNMDWMLTDRWETPEGFEPHYTERLLRMPDGYCCYVPPDRAPDVAPLPALARGHVTFGCYNNLAKVTPAVLRAWARILAALPTARLVLRTHALGDDPTRAAFLERAAALGMPLDRLELHGAVPHEALLAAYGEIDLSLDPFPYTGGLTVCESLWMGVPVLTKVSEGFAGRHALSHLSNVGLPDWAVPDEDAYVAEALRRATDLRALAELRAGLRARVAASPLCDGPRFGRNLGQALRQAWEQRVA
ncbi:tetratricopeptide repeat protein [Roseococcus microcysteis]|uniref:tetratricopeptide repeat protein n=1 Tax=Roseococcus microcysteis TaxID=2771361 RepID=UPI00168B5A10|nr:tetratricopeptide repeat protein [Roseococcus microcysteis]